MKKLFVLMFAAVLFVGFSACKQTKDAVNDAADAVTEVAEETVEVVGDAVDSTGAAIAEVADSAKAKVEEAVH